VGESKSEQVGLLSRIFLSADQWKNGLVIECAVAWRVGCLAEWSPATRDECVVDEI